MKREETGKKGEAEAEKHLRRKGFSILEKNYKNRHAEIDIIAKQREEIIFVEVRSTSTENFGTPEETIKSKKLEKIKKNVLAYITFKDIKNSYRIDLISILFNQNGELKTLKHYENITN